MMLNEFKCMQLVAEGGFGKVFRSQKKEEDDVNKVYALKEIENLESMENNVELNILRHVKHPLVIELIGSFVQENKFYFVFPYLSGGSLDDYLEREDILQESTASFYVREIVVGLEYLHSEGIFHRDVKPDNILLDAMGHIKITDFGISMENFSHDEVCLDTSGTLTYMAPEIILGVGCGFSADWYAVGVIFYLMVVGELPFDHENRESLKKKIIEGDYELPNNVSSKARSLIQNLLELNPEQRLGYTGANAIKAHEFFKHTRWDDVIRQLESPPCLYENSPANSSKCEALSANIPLTKNVRYDLNLSLLLLIGHIILILILYIPVLYHSNVPIYE